MPYSFETNKLTIPEEYDRRAKLTKEQREEIYLLYKNRSKNGTSQRKLAVKYKVSRRLIQFIINPEAKKKNEEIARNKNWYYNKEKHNKSMKIHRNYKKGLNSLNLLEENNR